MLQILPLKLHIKWTLTLPNITVCCYCHTCFSKIKLFPKKKKNLRESHKSIIIYASQHNVIWFPGFPNDITKFLDWVSKLIIHKFKFYSPCLKRLKIYADKLCDFVIDAPKLEYLYISDFAHSMYFFTKPLSLVEAHIDTRVWLHIIKCLIR